MFDAFNPWRRAVILRVSEAKDMGDVSRFELYDGMKTLLAAPPDVLECNEKNIKQHYVLNCVGVVITTNHLTNGIYLPAEDRRHYVAWSDCKPADFAPDYWTKMWKWYDEGGDRHVAAYLATLDISDFDPKAPPPKTPAFWSIVNANRTTEEAELQDILDKLGNPDAVTIEQIKDKAPITGEKDSLLELAQGPQEPQGHQPPARNLRLSCGEQSGRQRTGSGGSMSGGRWSTPRSRCRSGRSRKRPRACSGRQRRARQQRRRNSRPCGSTGRETNHRREIPADTGPH